ncbi:uncharacterized protein EDB91DRAFT_48474 [Suillus paluster]|uniref:uncharacterized protein n=1 Tax=Suillus paluster TaxID=48578 RepID=UPI001B887365|nr:uncharacterized protein EDB91DRAFT_48474 [Suillus paluster]KAG1747869.1 hypothetical protein EDB91DRAFT_48474 [Suillus paluster]
MPDLETPYSRAQFPSTNCSVVELEDRSIRAIIAERQQQLDAVSHHISSLETVMHSIYDLHRQLVEKKDKITQSKNLHKRLGSALWRLPTEILSIIFHYCLPPSPSPSPLEAPMLLTGICRRWREVAVGTPGLWCWLTVESQYDSEDWRREAFWCDSWIKRSRGLPLSLTLRCCSDQLRHFLQPYINQISSLSIRRSHTYQPAHLLTDLPALRELTINISNGDTWPALAQSISPLSTLHSLKIMGLWFDHEHLSSLGPVWTYLTNLEIAIIQSDGFLRLLQLCPNLASLMIRAGFSSVKALEPFTHPKLQSLRINCDHADTDDLSHLFDALSLPNLHVLEASKVEMWPHEAFKAFLSRSNCPLESLIFSAEVITDAQRAEYTAFIPSLEIVLVP